MKNVFMAVMLICFSTSTFAGGTLGGNPPVESGAVNVQVGKCTTYKLAVSDATKKGEDIALIPVPEGCTPIVK